MLIEDACFGGWILDNDVNLVNFKFIVVCTVLIIMWYSLKSSLSRPPASASSTILSNTTLHTHYEPATL